MSAAEIQEAKELIAELCANLYTQGHVSGTGGGISIKVADKIVMAPSGVQKERMRPEDMFVLDGTGNVLHTPEARPPPYKPPKLSECAPLFMSVRSPPICVAPSSPLPSCAACSDTLSPPFALLTPAHSLRSPRAQAYELRNAGAVLHGHSQNAMLATMLYPDSNEFRVTHMEMIKGIAGQGFYSNLVVPIIENTARECELTDRLRETMKQYPETNAVLVRRHGVYVWGDNWIHAKTQFECYDYLFEAAVRMYSLGMDARVAPPPPALPHANGTSNGHAAGGEPAAKRPRALNSQRPPNCVVLDIEGTVASIAFVAEVLFPYARARLRAHLESTYSSEETQGDLELLRQQAAADGVVFPPTSAPQNEVVAAAVALCESHMNADRKTTALKALQGHIWTKGFAAGELKAEPFRDVPDALATWRSQGIKTYIYSSGSRQAQRDLFGHTTVGDLRPYLSGFFDTTSGPKVEAPSYKNIALSLGVDTPGEILFATDNINEARAAVAAGWQVVMADRPGNAQLPADCEFRVVTSMVDLF